MSKLKVRGVCWLLLLFCLSLSSLLFLCPLLFFLSILLSLSSLLSSSVCLCVLFSLTFNLLLFPSLLLSSPSLVLALLSLHLLAVSILPPSIFLSFSFPSTLPFHFSASLSPLFPYRELTFHPPRECNVLCCPPNSPSPSVLQDRYRTA